MNSIRQVVPPAQPTRCSRTLRVDWGDRTVEYTKAAGALTIDDVNSLLTSSAGGFTWELGKDSTEVNRMYHRSDNRAVAHFAVENDGSLLIADDTGKTVWRVAYTGK